MSDVAVVVTEGVRGRPSKYDPCYCQAVIDDGSLGFSLTAFAGLIGVDRSTISEWRKVHPDFDYACQKHKAVRTRFLEGGMLTKGVTGPEAMARKFALVNAAPEDWREKVTVVGGDAESGDKPLQHEMTLRFVRATDAA